MLVKKLLAIAEIGSSVVLYLLIALSVISIGVIIERWWFFKKRKVDAKQLAADVLKKLDAGDRSGAEKYLKASPSVEAEVIVEALAWYDDGPDSVREILDKGVRDHRKSIEGGLLFLGTLGNNAPFIGLFGTILGIVTAFQALATTTAGSAEGGMNSVMSGIAEALVATAVGILVAIPAVVAYNVFSKRVADIEDHVAALGNTVIAHMQGTGGRGQPSQTSRAKREPAASDSLPTGASLAARRSTATEIEA